MDARAFCPAHVTGFFKAHMEGGSGSGIGSTGAGFSINRGVVTCVRVRDAAQNAAHDISTSGFCADKTDVSEMVIREFERMGCLDGRSLDVRHEISVPVGYGLGASGAAALSLALALDRALDINLGREALGRIAHNAEVKCRTGLGDVLASYHGGFEVRTSPGAPGVGHVERIDARGIMIAIACLSPVSTSGFITERLSRINGLGGRMVDRLLRSRSYEDFQDMSLEFARHAGVMTPRMQRITERLDAAGARCGVALFGETIFSMAPEDSGDRILDILGECPGGIVIKAGLDDAGARILG